MSLWDNLRARWRPAEKPAHLQRGAAGELAARRHLQRAGLKFLTANYRAPRGELDLVFRDGDCLVFVEVKTRSSEDWTRPAAAVNAKKRRRLTLAALDYLKRLGHPAVRFRFDIVEVLWDGDQAREVRHLSNAFTLTPPFRYS
jgi:putative endonuclease